MGEVGRTGMGDDVRFSSLEEHYLSFYSIPFFRSFYSFMYMVLLACHEHKEIGSVCVICGRISIK